MPRNGVARCLAATLVALLFVAVTACNEPASRLQGGSRPTGTTIVGSGQLVTWEVDEPFFNEVSTPEFERENSEFQLDVSWSDTFSITVTADDNLREHFFALKRLHHLLIGLRGDNTYDGVTLRIAITMPEIIKYNLQGGTTGSISGFDSDTTVSLWASAGSQLATDDMRFDTARFEIQSGGHVSGNIRMTDGSVNLSGASTIDIDGASDSLKLSASGESSADLEGFTTENATVTLRGGSSATVNASGTLEGELSDGSELFYVGDPTLGAMEVSEDSTVEQK